MSYSPFDCNVVAVQTQSGLLQKEANEVDLLVVDNVELRSGNTEPMVPLNAKNQVDVAKTNGKWVDRTESNIMLQLTTHRLVFWRDNGGGSRDARYLHHSQVLSHSTESGYFKSPKIELTTAALGELILVFAKDKSKLRDDCYAALQRALSRQEWEEKTAISVATTKVSKRRVGVDAILAQNNLRHQQAAKLADTAFKGDAETLLREARDLVKVIHRYVATLERQNESGGEDTSQLVGMLQNMGMASALTKADFQGREGAYQAQLARELADFMRPRFTPTNPVWTLTDVYCLFNRARGSNLISPEDLMAAAEKCDKLNLGLSLSTFPSGLVVLQDDSLSDPKIMGARLQDLMTCLETASLTAMDVSRHWHISAVLAMEQLQAAERSGILARDETLETLRFYPNRFSEF